MGISGETLVLLFFGAVLMVALVVVLVWAILDIIRTELRKASER